MRRYTLKQRLEILPRVLPFLVIIAGMDVNRWVLMAINDLNIGICPLATRFSHKV